MRSPSGTWGPVLALAASVLALHLALLAAWQTPSQPLLGTRPQGPVRPSVQLLPVPLADRVRPALGDPEATMAGDAAPGAPAGPGPLAAAPTRLATALLPPRRAAAPSPVALAPAQTPPDPPAPAAPGQDTPAAAAASGERADPSAGEDEAEALAAAAVGAQPSAGEPPPLYPARLPAAATLRYALHYYGREGDAVLVWRPAGVFYSLQLLGLAAATPDPPAPAASAPGAAQRRAGHGPARPLIEQFSQGRIDATGLQPDRFTDRRRGRAQRAASFRHERGQIGFSGGASPLPAWPGAQDRLSWWVQLPAIVAAAAAVPAEIRLFVVDARGRGELWRLQPVASGDDPADASPPAWQHWRHEPETPDGQRVELWLDPARGHWPARLRLTLLRSGDRLDLRLRAIEPAP